MASMGRREMIAWITSARKTMFVQKVLIFAMVVAVASMGAILYRTKTVMAAEVQKLETANAELEQENFNLSENNSALGQVVIKKQETIQEQNEDYAVVQEAAAEYAQIAYDIQDQNEQLASANAELLAENQELAAKYNDIANSSRLLKEYGYALYDSSGRRNDIGVEQLILVEQACANAGISPHVSLGIIMAESEGHAQCKNPKSTASGAAQFLNETGRFVWTSLMGGSNYDHSTTPMNINNAIRMQVVYLAYLKRQTGSMMGAIKRYRGKNDVTGYLNRANSFLKKYGYNIYDYI